MTDCALHIGELALIKSTVKDPETAPQAQRGTQLLGRALILDLRHWARELCNITARNPIALELLC